MMKCKHEILKGVLFKLQTLTWRYNEYITREIATFGFTLEKKKIVWDAKGYLKPISPWWCQWAVTYLCKRRPNQVIEII